MINHGSKFVSEFPKQMLLLDLLWEFTAERNTYFNPEAMCDPIAFPSEIVYHRRQKLHMTVTKERMTIIYDNFRTG